MPDEVPPGIFPVFLTMTTQEMFKVVSDQHVTAEMPHKRVNIAEILKDINFRGVISDWQPAKKEIEKYATDLPKEPGDDPTTTAHILCVLDDENVYGQNYFICLDEATAEATIAKYATKAEAAAAEEAAVAVEEEEPRPREIMDPDPVNRPWKEWTPYNKLEGEGDEHDVELQKKKEAYITTSIEIASAAIVDKLGTLTGLNRGVKPERYKYAFSRKRALFRQGGKFYDVDNVEAEDFKQYRDPQFKENPEQPGVFGTRPLLRDAGNSCVPTTTSSNTQTARYRLVNSMVQYAPIVQQTDDKAKIKESDDLLQMFERALPLVEEALSTNETVDVFQDVLANLGESETLGNTSDNAIKEYSSPFTDIDYSKNKIISAIDWMPDAKGLVAVACTERASLDEQIDMDGKVRTSHILIWNFKDPIHPQMVLEAPYDIESFRFNPQNANKLVAGCTSGQLLLYDLTDAKASLAKRDKASSSGSAPDGATAKDNKTIKQELMSTIENSHKRNVTHVQWLPSDREIDTKPKNAGQVLSTPTTTDGVSQQLLSVAADGLILFWDVRVKKEDKTGSWLWTPVWRIQLSMPDGSGDVSGLILCLRNKPDALPPVEDAADDGQEKKPPAAAPEDRTWKHHFAIGTEDGQVAQGTWVMPEGENANYISSTHKSHYSPLVALQRSPFFEDCLLTVGDWTFSLLMKPADEAIVKSSFAATYLTCGRFSPTRPGVIFTARADGCLDIWDLMDRSHEPSLQHNVSPESVTALEFWGDSQLQLLAVGDKQGTLHILEIPRALRRPAPNEEAVVEGLLKREVARVGYMRSRLAFREKELAVKEAQDEERRQAEEAAAAASAAAEAAAREAAEAEAQALVEGDGSAVAKDEKVDEAVAAPTKMSKEDEASENKFRALEKEFRKKVGLDKDD